jgi:hypothetical protein
VRLRFPRKWAIFLVKNLKISQITS